MAAFYFGHVVDETSREWSVRSGGGGGGLSPDVRRESLETGLDRLQRLLPKLILESKNKQN